MRWLLLLLALVTVPLKVPPAVPEPKAPAYSEDDVCMAWAIHDEARGEPKQGQKAVYDVIKHRMKARNMTACEVVKQPSQFSGYKRGMKLVTDEAMLQRLDEVSKMRPVVPNADYFHAKHVQPYWASKMKKVLTVGKHVFYTFHKPKNKEKVK